MMIDGIEQGSLVVVMGGVPINILVLFLACYRIVLLYRLLSMIMGLTLVTYM